MSTLPERTEEEIEVKVLSGLPHPRFFSGAPNRVYPDYTAIVVQDGHEYTSRNGKVKEILNPVIQFTQPEFPFLFTHGRMVNLAFAMAEVIWILAGRNDVKLVDYFNSNIKNYSDDGEVFNAAYGYRMRHFGLNGVDQLEDTIKFLQTTPDTRHAGMVYRDPWLDSPTRITNDRACNLISHFLLRDKRLHMMQVIRSSDAIWGVPFNLVQWSHVLRYIAARLSVDVGYMTFHIHSGHIYEKFWPEVDSHRVWDPFEPYYNYKKFPLFENRMDTTDPGSLATKLESLINPELAFFNHEVIPGFWKPYFRVFSAYRAFKDQKDELALDLTIDTVPWPYNVLLAKNFFTWRWHKPEFAASELQLAALEFGTSHSPGDWFYEQVPHRHEGPAGNRRLVLDTKGV